MQDPVYNPSISNYVVRERLTKVPRQRGSFEACVQFIRDNAYFYNCGMLNKYLSNGVLVYDCGPESFFIAVDERSF